MPSSEPPFQSNSAHTASPTRTTPPVTTEAAPPPIPKRLGSGNPVTFAFGGDVIFEEPIRSYAPADVFEKQVRDEFQVFRTLVQDFDLMPK